MSSKSKEKQAKRCKQLDEVQAASFRSNLRQAREICARDAEAFVDVLSAIERLGSYLDKTTSDLSTYEHCLSHLAERSQLCTTSAEDAREDLPHFGSLFKSVREARNDALHQGAVARHLAARAVELALILEDALATLITRAVHIMVKNPVTAEPWQTLSSVRIVMLSNAFSYVPIYWNDKWSLLADHHLAPLLRTGDRKKNLTLNVEDALADQNSPLKTEEPRRCEESTSVDELAGLMTDSVPILVMRGDHLVGLIAPADLL